MKQFSVLLIVFSVLCLNSKVVPRELQHQADALFKTVKVKKGDTFLKLFGKNWEFVSRLNRVGPKTLRNGMILKVPLDWKLANGYTPAPDSLRETAIFEQFVLVDLEEQYVAGYEKGIQRFWYPVSSGCDTVRTPHWYIREVVKHDNLWSGHVYKIALPDMSTPTGFFKVRARDSVHASNAFMTEDSVGSPMPWAVMFENGYWFHGTDNEAGALPGFPASHGCVRLFDGDAFKFYRWAKRGTLILIAKNKEEFCERLKKIPENMLPKKSKSKSSRK